MNEKSKLAEVAKVFLKLGFIGFGGPAVHIALMEEEIVRKRHGYHMSTSSILSVLLI